MTKLPWHAKAKKGLSDFETILYSTDDDESPEEDRIDDTRRVRTKPKFNLAKSTAPWRDFTILRKPDDSLFVQMAARAVGYQHSAIAGVITRILLSRRDSRVPAGLTDTAAEALHNRAKLEKYNAERPVSEYPEYKLFPREQRNTSLTRKKDAGLLNAFWDYRELNKSFEPLQSNYMQADNDNRHERGHVEGDLRKPERNLEAELEMRPNLTELKERWLPGVQYETRMVSTVDFPRLIEPGYCLTCGKTEMKIPISGDVLCIGLHGDRWLEYQSSARDSLPKRGVRRTPKQITDYVDRVAKPDLLSIGNVARDGKCSIYQMGGLRFNRGQVTHYRDEKNKDRWLRAKEGKYGTPHSLDSNGSNPIYWKPLYPRPSKSKVALLSPADRAKQLANKAKPIQCLPPTDEMLEDYRRLKPLSNVKPVNGNNDCLPCDVDSADELQFGYAFGATYPDSYDFGPFNDIAERESSLAAINARLSPQARLVANMVVQTDETETLAQNYADVGAALGGKPASGRTMMRRGQNAVNDAAKEINAIRQELAA